MSTLIADDLTEQGIAAFKGGDRRAAAQLLFRATQEDPANQRAWLWLAGAAPSPEGQHSCLERVVAIDPASPLADKARAGLAQLGPAATPAPTPPATAPAMTTIAPESTPIAATPAIPVPPPSLATPPQTVVASPVMVAVPALTLPPLPPATTPTPAMKARPAQTGGAPWADIVLIIASCAVLGWLVGSGAFPEFWAITMMTSVALFGLPSAIIYHGKGRSAILGFIVGSGLGLIGLLIVALAKPDQKHLEANQMTSGELRRCPSCGELVRSEAKVCRFCQRDLPAVAAPPSQARRSNGRFELVAGAAAAIVLLFVSLYFGALTGFQAPTSRPNIEATINAGLRD